MAALYVKLKPAEQAMVKELRAGGENISEVVRQAIRQRYAAAHRRKPGKNAVEVLDQVLVKHKVPKDLPAHGIDLADRRTVSAYIREKLARKPRR